MVPFLDLHPIPISGLSLPRPCTRAVLSIKIEANILHRRYDFELIAVDPKTGVVTCDTTPAFVAQSEALSLEFKSHRQHGI